MEKCKTAIFNSSFSLPLKGTRGGGGGGHCNFYIVHNLLFFNGFLDLSSSYHVLHVCSQIYRRLKDAGLVEDSHAVVKKVI